ncbi:MAG: hypothetical protein JXR97_11060, partial [Planctomycetes bacterium]|nr:hypothetical protein [Planctomycetota bacterium]
MVSQVSKSLILALLAAFLINGEVRADILHLMNDGMIEGEVVQTKDGDYLVTNDVGTITIKADQVRYWEKKYTKDVQYDERVKRLKDKDFDGQMELAEWCRKNNLPEKAKWHYTIAVSLRPDDRKARLAAGFVWTGSKWITADESMRRKGYEKFGDKWYPAAEALKLQMESERKEKYKEVYKKAWVILQSPRQNTGGQKLAEYSKELIALGDMIADPLERASSDGSWVTRKLVIATCGQMNDSRSLDILIRRMQVEKLRPLMERIFIELARRKDRLDVLQKLLDNGVNSSFSGVRKRSSRALGVIGDERAIEA